MFFFLPYVPRLLFKKSFPLFQELFFFFLSYSFRLGLMVKILLVFLHPRRAWFLKYIFSGYRILGWKFFTFSTWNILCHHLLNSAFSERKSTVFQVIFSPISNMSFLSCCLKDFLFLVFRIILTVISLCGFLWVILVWDSLSPLNL